MHNQRETVMREYYDVQVIRQQREQEAANQREVAAARAANAQPNRVLMWMGRAMETIGTQMQQRARQDAQRQTRRAYR
jgi:hypothetical protein